MRRFRHALHLTLVLVSLASCGSEGGPALDSGSLDSGSLDSGSPDSGSPDSGSPDSGSPDSSEPDTSIVDTEDAATDVGPPDANDASDATDASAPDGDVTVTCEPIPDCAESTCVDGIATCTRCEDGFGDDGGGGCRDVDDCASSPCGDGTCVDLGADLYACRAEPIEADQGGSVSVVTPLGEVVVTAGPDVFVDALGQLIEGEVFLVVTPVGFDGTFAVEGGDVIAPVVLLEIHFEDAAGNEVMVAAGQTITAVLPLPLDAGFDAGDGASLYVYREADAAWAVSAAGTVVARAGGLGFSVSFRPASWYAVGSVCDAIARCQRVDCDTSRCSECVAGYVPDAAGACVTCAAGSFGEGLTCVPCSASDVVGCSATSCSDADDTQCVACASGYRLDAGACVDVDDCAAAPCGAGTCSDTGTNAWTCDCPDGSFGDGTTTCAACAPSPVVGCAAVTCVAAAASTCVACAAGYDLSGTSCVDIDDCAAAPCGSGTCSDTGANAWSCACPDGSFGDGTRACTTCATIAGCTTVTCGSASDATCVACASGFALDDGACAAIDECAGNGACASGQCVDGAASFTCTCPDGFFGDGTTSCTACDPIAGCAVLCTSKSDERCADCDARVCEPLDGCHVAGTCDAGTGLCSNPSGNEGGTCTDHDACTTGDSCAGGTCAGTPKTCTAADACHVVGTCDPSSGVCSKPIGNEGGACNDGLATTHSDKCAAGTCGGTTVTCPATTACTTWAPNGSATCTPTYTTATCNDERATTYNDTCSAGVCAGTAVTCPSDTTCTHYAPNGTATCTPSYTTVACNDANPATHSDVCSAGSCGGTAVTCPSDTTCTRYTPNGTATCSPTYTTVACDDANPATHSDTCGGGACVGTAVTCPSDTACVRYAPNGTATCGVTHTTSTCDDANVATHSDTCSAGACVGTAVTCPSDATCATYTPNGTATCTTNALAGACDDANLATHSDTCSGGACVGTAVTCPSDTVCTTYAANGTATCTPTQTSAACDDDDDATHSDTCSAGACVGTAVTCPSDTTCTTHAPNGSATCTATHTTASCDDGDAATHDDTCAAGTCEGTAVVCPSDTVCTTYTPNGSDTCSVVNTTAVCDDDDACTTVDRCQAGTCVGVTPKICTALDDCHAVGTCDPETGVCSQPAKDDDAPCVDADPCTHSDTCQSGVCNSGPEIVCVASDSCHDAGTCDPETGACSETPKEDFALCDDGNACTEGEFCSLGVCLGAALVTCPDSRDCDGAIDCASCGYDWCDPAVGACKFEAFPENYPCDLDGDLCGSADACDGTGSCEAGALVVCDDPGDCNLPLPGACDPGSGTCVYTSDPDMEDQECGDADVCERPHRCYGGTCYATGDKCQVDFDDIDQSQCQVATCDPITGECGFANQPDGLACDDGAACTIGDACLGGVCQGYTMECGKGCVGDLCDPTGYALTFTAGNPFFADEARVEAGPADGHFAGQLTDGQDGGVVPSAAWVGFRSDATVVFRFPHDRWFSTVSVGLLVDAGNDFRQPDGLRFEFSDDGQTWGAPPWDNVGLQRRGELHFQPDWSNWPTLEDGKRSVVELDLRPREAMWVRISIDGSAAGLSMIDEVRFGAPESRERVCHLPGRCEEDWMGQPGCVFEPSEQGTTCDDGNACSSEDACYSGQCYGIPDYGEPCDDGNLCTDDDACDGTATCKGNQPFERCQFHLLSDEEKAPLIASDNCRSYGCNPETGACETTVQPDGRFCKPTYSCDDPWEGPCTDEEWCSFPNFGSCQAGSCERGPLTPFPQANCEPPYAYLPDACHETPTCVANKGHDHACFYPPKPDGTTCDDGNICSVGDACIRDFYPAYAPWVADSYGDSHCAGTPLPSGTVCNQCSGSTCEPGPDPWNANLSFCQGGEYPQPPVLNNPCKVQGEAFFCDGQTGEWGPIYDLPDGTGCDTGSLCPRPYHLVEWDSDGDGIADSSYYQRDELDGTCQGGTCTAPEWVYDGPIGPCQEPPTCDPATGNLDWTLKPDGTACSDRVFVSWGMPDVEDHCTEGSTCAQGVCMPGGANVERKYCGISCLNRDFETPNSYFYIPESCSPDGYAIAGGQFADGPLTDGVSAAADPDDAGWTTVAAAAGSTVLTFRMQRQRDFTTVSLGVLANAADDVSAPSAIVVAFSQDGSTWVDDKTFSVATETLATVADGTRAELTLAIPWVHDAAYDAGAGWSEPDYVRLTIEHAGALRLDEVTFGDPPVVLPECHDFASCDPDSGGCAFPPIGDGTTCDDENPCTQTDGCQQGSCVGTNPIVCVALDECHVAGTCDTADGECSNPEAPEGTDCSEGAEGPCRESGCVAGVCTFSDSPASKLCDDADGCTGDNVMADAGLNPVLAPDHCQDGVCMGGDSTVCQGLEEPAVVSEQCTSAYVCDPSWFVGHCLPIGPAEFRTCNDGDPTTSNDYCSGTTCRGGYATCLGTPQMELLNAHTGGLVKIERRYTYLYNNPPVSFTRALAWADGTSIDLPPSYVPEGTRVVISVVDENDNRRGWYTSYAPLAPLAEVVPEPPAGTWYVWWPVSFAPCAADLPGKVTMTLRYNAVTDKPGFLIGGPVVASNPGPGTVVNQWNTRNLIIVRHDGDGSEKIIPDRVDPASGIITFRASELGLFIVAVELSPQAPTGLCTTDFHCNDHSYATTDTCVEGTCHYAPSRTDCGPPPDVCHGSYVIDPATGACTYPALTGNACDDTQGCTINDACAAGVCKGSPKVCVASGQCKVAQYCIADGPLEGQCHEVNEWNGVPCNDNNPCTTLDSCQGGACAGGPATVCRAKDQCHVAGVCDPAIGCPDPAAPDNTGCNDGNACTQGEVCLTGVCSAGAAVVCPAPDNCHEQGVCSPQTGCSNPAKPNSTKCDDSNPCTVSGTCQAGVCKNLSPVVCAAADNCHGAGVCDPTTGACSSPEKADGTTCHDTDICTGAGQCAGGVCGGLEALQCGYSPTDPPLSYRYDTGGGACNTQTQVTTCYNDPPHGLVSAYARGILTDSRKGGPLDDGTWVGLPGDTQITLRASNVRELTTLHLGFGTATHGTIVARVPPTIEVWKSNDGVTFSDKQTFSRAAGTLPAIADGGRGDIYLELRTQAWPSARYVRIKTSGNGSNWTFIDELALGAPCVYGGCIPGFGTCGLTYANDGTACGGPGDTCRYRSCTDCSALGKIDCGGVCVTPGASGSCLTPATNACLTVSDCASYPWLITSCVSGSCAYQPNACDGVDVDLCKDGLAQPDGSCRELGPVLLWDFDDGKTATVIDETGSGKVGRWVGGAVAFGAGRIAPGSGGDSLVMTAANKAVVVGSVAIPKTGFTIGAHFKTTTATGGLFTAASTNALSTIGVSGLDRYANIASGKLRAFVSTTSWQPFCESSARVDDGQWHHAALTCVAGGGCHVYLDGQRICSGNSWNDASTFPTGNAFAAGWTSNGGHFQGELDQVVVYDRGMDGPDIDAFRAGILTPLQGRNRPTCDGVDRTCGAFATSSRCDDGNQCTTNDGCSAGVCAAGASTLCQGGECYSSACNVVSGICEQTKYAYGTACTDGDSSTSSDKCEQDAVCRGTPVVGASSSVGASGTLSPPAAQEPVNFLKRLERGPVENWDTTEMATPTCTIGVDCDALEYAEDSGYGTEISVTSAGWTLPRVDNMGGDVGNIYVANAEEFPPKGQAVIQSSTGIQLVSYGARSKTQLMNVTGGTGTLAAGGAVVFNGNAAELAAPMNGLSLPQATLQVSNANNFTLRGEVHIKTSSGPQTVKYTGRTGTTLTGCTGGAGTLTTGKAVIQFYKSRWMMLATVTTTPPPQEVDFAQGEGMNVSFQHINQVAMPLQTLDRVAVTGTTRWNGTWPITQVPNSPRKFTLDGASWEGSGTDDNRGTVTVVPRGFVGWQQAKSFRCPNGDPCADENASCSGGATCVGTVVPKQFKTSGPVSFFASPELYKRDGATYNVNQSNIPASVADFTVNTGIPLQAAARLSIPVPRNKFDGGWGFDPPFIAAGIGPGSELRHLGAPLKPERGYIFGSALAGIGVYVPGVAQPLPIAAQFTFAVDPTDPAFFMAMSVPPGVPTNWLGGAVGFSAKGQLRHQAQIPLWNGKALPLGTTFSDAVNANKREIIVNPANVYLNLKRSFTVPKIPVDLFVEGFFSMYWGENGPLPIDWATFKMIDTPQRVSGLIEATVGLNFKPKLKGVPIPLGLPLGQAALYFESDPTSTPPSSRAMFRGTTTEVPLSNIKGLEWTKTLGVHAEVNGYFGIPDTRCDGACTADDMAIGLRLEVAAPIPFPGGFLPFRGTFQFAKEAGRNAPLDLSLDLRISGATFGLGPGLGVEIGTAAVNLQYDGEKFCMGLGTSIPAGNKQVDTSSTQTQSTTCALRLCMGYQGDFFRGSVLDCDPFCIDDAQCDGGDVCIYGSCDAPRATGLACEEGGDCANGHCYLGLCKECEVGANGEQGYCKNGTTCASAGVACADGSTCVVMAKASMHCDQNAGDAARNDEFCDSFGYCQAALLENASCWDGQKRRADWCASPLVCDQTGPASAICHHCYAPGVYNEPLVGDVGGGCKDRDKPREQSTTQFCNTFGDCQDTLDFGESCFSPGLGVGLDQWCKSALGRTSGDCGDPAWTCRECGYDSLPSGVIPDALLNPSPACPTGEYCHGGTLGFVGPLVCKSKLGIGAACGFLGGADDRKCTSGACDKVCFDYASVDYGGSCQTAGKRIPGMCKSGQCLVSNDTCACTTNAQCGSSRYCDLLGVCHNKLGTGEGCAGIGDSACVDGHCSVFGDALPGFCYQAESKNYNDACYANAECKSGQCKAGRCGCGHKASQCAAGQFCGGADGDICINKLPAGAICQQDGRQCLGGQCNYFSPGIYVCGCNADNGNPDDGKCGWGDYCNNSNVCRVRIPAGSICTRSGECWRTASGNPSPCDQTYYNCNCDSWGANCSSCPGNKVCR